MSPNERAGSVRLTGTLEGRVLSYSIPARGAIIGYRPSSDVYLPIRGVSRRHAALEWEAGRLVVVDLASKNGTFVNGQRVTRAALAPGDTLQIGAICLSLLQQRQGDEELALELALPTEPDPETDWVASAPATPASAIGGIERLCELLLDREQPDLSSALRLVLERTGAVGAALGEWDGEGEPRLFAISGEVGSQMEHPSLFRFFRGVFERGATAFCCEASRLDHEPSYSCAGLRRPGQHLLAMVIRGGARDGSETLQQLRILLRLVDQARLHSPGVPKPRTDAAFGMLAVPLGFLRGSSPQMQSVYQQIDRVRRGSFPVLVLGETGVGKEHIVRLLHDSSLRSAGPFVAVNCAALPAELLEAEMFGVARGVATGVSERAGRMREADGGTLFLDEIGDMPLGIQAKLLRALEARQVEPLGGGAVDVDVRIVAATNNDLRLRMAEGRFRQDLYYRIAGYTLEVPPLRERRGDIPGLLQHFLGRFCRESGNRIPGVTLRAMELLTLYDWPGNVRELEHEARRLAFVCPMGVAIDSTMLSGEIQGGAGEASSTGSDVHPAAGPSGLRPQLDLLERSLVVEALERSGGSRRRAARLLGVSRNGLAIKLRRLGLDSRQQAAAGGAVRAPRREPGSQGKPEVDGRGLVEPS